MSQPVRVQAGFRQAMKRDDSRDALSDEAVWNLQDYLPEILGAPLVKRGGYTYATQAISSVSSTATYIVAGIVAPFSAGTVNMCWDEDGRAYAITSGTTATTAVSAAPTIVTTQPVFYSNTVITPDAAGSVAPRKFTYSGGVFTEAVLSGTPPAGRYAVIYKDVLWLASSSASADRIWFSTAGNPNDTWDTTNKYLDVSYPITGMAAMANAVFIFSLERTARVRGSIPPPDTDFIVDDPIFEVGCTDHRSIGLYRDKMIWANAQGLYISDGSAMEDLTAICGMKSWWLDVMGGREGFATGTEYSASTWTITGKVYREYYIYSVMNGSTKVDSGIVDLKNYTWMRVKNLDAVSMWPNPFPAELYFGRRGASYVGKASTYWVPASAVSADADGTAVEPVFETGFLGYDAIVKTLRSAFLEYDIRDPGSANPYLTMSYIDSPEETSYTALDPTFLETLELTKDHVPLNFPARGIAFKVAQTNASAATRIYGLGVHAIPREGNR